MASAQSDSTSLTIGGYVKYLNGAIYSPQLPKDNAYLLDNLLHNRLNAEWKFAKSWNLSAGLRTRVFWGDLVKSSSEFSERIEQANNDHFDLSLHLLDQESALINTYLDRFYLQYSKDDWEVTLGRQRINWGIQTFWNPHDLFNIYNFVDFDYEERPGSDGLNITWYQGYSGQVDFAVKYFDQWSDAVVAGRYKFAVQSYDVQIIGGKYLEDYVLGLGWAGNVGNGGFKGEASYFLSEDGQSHAFTGSAGGEYVFANGLFLASGFLYNSEGSTDGDLSALFDFELSAKNLYPYNWSIYSTTSIGIGSLSAAGITVIYSPVEVNPLFLIGTISYSVGNDWDLDLTTQWAFDAADDSFGLGSSVAYLRMRWSF